VIVLSDRQLYLGHGFQLNEERSRNQYPTTTGTNQSTRGKHHRPITPPIVPPREQDQPSALRGTSLHSESRVWPPGRIFENGLMMIFLNQMIIIFD